MIGCSLFDWANPVVTTDAGDASDASGDVISDGPFPTDGGAWTCESVTADPDIKQALPPIVAVDMPQNTTVVSVASTDDLQQKINAAKPGDILELEAGATFTGPFSLRPFSGTGWIIIRTATPDTDFAMPGTRVSPALAPKMAKLTAPSSAVVTLLNGTGGYRMIGLEIEASTGPTVDLTAGGVHDMILDRVYLHGAGLVLHGQGVALIDSYLSGATLSYSIRINGGGPFRVTNDAIDSPASHVQIESGSGIEICQNVMTSDSGSNTYNFQINDASAVLIAGNLLSSLGTTLLLQQGVQSDVTVAYNRTTHANEYLFLTDGMTNVVVHDNLFDSSDPVGNEIRLFGSPSNPITLKIDHNTFTTGLGSLLALSSSSGTFATSFVYTNNFAPFGQYGVLANGGDAGAASGTAGLDGYLGAYTFTANAIWGNPGAKSSYPTGNLFPANEQAVGFATDWSLTSSSAYKGAASDGKDIGADIATVTAATKNVP